MTHERRVFLDITKCLISSDELTLPKDIKHHLFSVLRIKEGENVIVVDTSKTSSALPQYSPDSSTTVYQTHASALKTLKIISSQQATEPKQSVMCVAPALSKGDTNDIIIEKSVELGISHIAIWQSERSIPIVRNQTDLEKKLLRWQKISLAAAQQSGRITTPDISFSFSASELCSQLTKYCNSDKHYLLYGSLGDNALPLYRLYEKYRAWHSHPFYFSIIIGPEGDFSPNEEAFLSQQATPVSLGQRRLKVDTAAISAIAMLDVLFLRPDKEYN